MVIETFCIAGKQKKKEEINQDVVIYCEENWPNNPELVEDSALRKSTQSDIYSRFCIQKLDSEPFFFSTK